MGKNAYLSGAISNLDDDLCQVKFKAAELFVRQDAEKWDVDCKVINPMDYPDNGRWGQYMIASLPLLDMCDIIYFQPDWEVSPDALIEKIFAEREGKRCVFITKEELDKNIELLSKYEEIVSELAHDFEHSEEQN